MIHISEHHNHKTTFRFTFILFHCNSFTRLLFSAVAKARCVCFRGLGKFLIPLNRHSSKIIVIVCELSS